MDAIITIPAADYSGFRGKLRWLFGNRRQEAESRYSEAHAQILVDGWRSELERRIRIEDAERKLPRNSHLH